MNVLLRALSLSMVLGLASTAAAQTAPATSAAPAAAAKPPKQKALPGVKDITCEAFLQLPEGARPMLVGWVAGQNYRRGAFAPWAVSSEKASEVIGMIAEECRKSPAASFWYKTEHALRQYK